MALNQTKSVSILFGTPQKLKSLSRLNSVNVAGRDIQLSDKLKILGATLDSNFTMESHIKALSSSCFYNIRSFKQIRSPLDYDMAISVASALVSLRLDQVNSILYGAASQHTDRFQRVQKALARIFMHQRSHCSPLSSTALLQNLHWLPIEWRIRFKLATLAYIRPKFHLARLDTTRHVRLCRASRDERVERDVCRAVLLQHGERRRSSSACVYKFSVLCFERTCK